MSRTPAIVLLSLLPACTGNIEDLAAEAEPAQASERVAGGKGGTVPPAPGCSATAGAARVSLRRLNQVEFDNTVRDLLGETGRPSQELPADDTDERSGFDTIADVLLVNSQYLAAVQRVTERLAQTAAASPRVVTCSPAAAGGSAACAEQVLRPLARRAWRRAVTSDEVAELVGIVRATESQGDGFVRGMELAIQRILLSPRFLFRVEPVGDPTSPRAQPLDGFALASRLSYFLWRSMPDDALLAAAEAGKLGDPRELEAQATRLLADPKAGAMVQDLTRQWLLGAATRVATPDATLFKGFDAALRAGLPQETELFLGELVKSNRSLLDLMDADFTFLNERVARHYGISGVTGATFRKVALAGHAQRGGLLTQANLHVGTMTSPTRTSIEGRGVWVLRRLLCTEPSEPPPDVLEAQDGILKRLGPGATGRQISEARNALPACGGCHRMFDPIGYGLENYDVIGAWRTTDRAQPIDARGELAGVGAFDGPRELAAALRRDPRLSQCLARTLATFALGRLFEEDEHCAVRAMAEQAAQRGFGVKDLVGAVVQSPAFRSQSGEPN